jgi:hypothetical protein
VLVVATGVAAGLAGFGASMLFGGRPFFRLWTRYRPLSPTPADGGTAPGVSL